MTNADIEALLQEIGELRRQLNKGDNKQIFSEPDKARMRALASMYVNARAGIEGIAQLSDSDELFRALTAMSRGNPSRTKVQSMLAAAKRLIVALEGVVMFVVLWAFSMKPRARYAVSGLFALLYGVFRFIVEFVRVPDAPIGYLAFNWLTMGQILSLPLIAVGLVLLAMSRRAPVLQPVLPAPAGVEAAK